MRYVATQVRSYRVSHDASGKVVVRSVDRDDKEQVIAVAQWTDAGTTNRRQLKPNRPKPDAWVEIDQAVRTALAAAASLLPDDRLDPGDLPTGSEVEPAEAKPEPKLTVVGTIGAVIVLAVLGVGLYFAWPHLKVFVDKTGKANGEACKYDRECRSGVCDFSRCAVGKRPKGDRCDFDSQCASGDCRRKLCD